MDQLNPITGSPYGSQEEWEYVGRLNQPQREYLQELVKAKRKKPNPAADGDTDPRDLSKPEPKPAPNPKPKPKPEPEPEPSCFATDVLRRGGHGRHDAYATKVTRTPNDYYVLTPTGLKINYDGLLHGSVQVWEVKVGFGWFFNPEYAGVRDATLARWDAQKNLGMAVASECGYIHLWAHPDRHVARMVTTRWGGAPPVLNIPE
ncbi:hypothetical protein ACFYSW_29590 [Rhodococcus aetherivorans]|uniref:hypothetical protein n=1 Tax=Rhodococcus aetherivorans TaxID=191292 RepID=UPI0036A576FB